MNTKASWNEPKPWFPMLGRITNGNKQIAVVKQKLEASNEVKENELDANQQEWLQHRTKQNKTKQVMLNVSAHLQN